MYFLLLQEWALGLLHMKCTCGVIWLTNTPLKRTLDTLYQNGARNLNLAFVVKSIVSPVVCNLILCLAVPYVSFLGVLKLMGKNKPIVKTSLLDKSIFCFLLYHRHFFSVQLSSNVSLQLSFSTGAVNIVCSSNNYCEAIS